MSSVSGQVEMRPRSVLLQTPQAFRYVHTMCIHTQHTQRESTQHTHMLTYASVCTHTVAVQSVLSGEVQVPSLVTVGKSSLNCWSRVNRRARASPSGPSDPHWGCWGPAQGQQGSQPLSLGQRLGCLLAAGAPTPPLIVDIQLLGLGQSLDELSHLSQLLLFPWLHLSKYFGCSLACVSNGPPL